MRHVTRIAFTMILLVAGCLTALSQAELGTTPPPCSPSNPQHVLVDQAFLYAKVTGRANNLVPMRCWLAIASSEGSADAQFQYAVVLEHGVGGPADPQESFFWVKRAAEQGQPIATVDLSYFYQTGFGTPKDPAKATYWLQRALQFPAIRKSLEEFQARQKAQTQANARLSQDLEAAALEVLLKPELDREAKLTPEQRNKEAQRLANIEALMDDPRCDALGRRQDPEYCRKADAEWEERKRKAILNNH